MHNSVIPFDANGSRRSTVFTHPEKNALAPEWSRAHGQIVLGLGDFFQNARGETGKADIATISADGKDLKVFTNGQANYGFPSWSGDGRQIVYREATRERSALLVLDVESGRSRTILERPAHYNFTAWSPTAELIAFTADMDGDSEIYTIRADGTDLKRLTNSPGNDAHQTWSPEGKWIAFTTARRASRTNRFSTRAIPSRTGRLPLCAPTVRMSAC